MTPEQARNELREALERVISGARYAGSYVDQLTDALRSLQATAREVQERVLYTQYPPSPDDNELPRHANELDSLKYEITRILESVLDMERDCKDIVR